MPTARCGYKKRFLGAIVAHPRRRALFLLAALSHAAEMQPANHEANGFGR
jgi:hypothetical protein